MTYIRYQEMEVLLKIYPYLAETIQSFKLEIERLAEGADNDDIVSLALKHSSLEEIVARTPGYISDRTASIATNYEEKIKA